jgi:hypothetical protein
MKFIKAFIVVVLLGLACMLLIGVFVPEIDDEVELKIDRPIITVFAGYVNTQDATLWINDLESIQRTSGVLAMPGSTFELTFRSKETKGVYTLEVIELVPMKSIRCKLYNDMLEMEINTNFEADGLATDMNVFVQMKGSGIVSRSMLPLMKSVVMDEVRQNFENFKDHQEN